jgi:hypothetical protein
MSVCSMAGSNEMAKHGRNMLYGYESVETYQYIPEFSTAVVETCMEDAYIRGRYCLPSG